MRLDEERWGNSPAPRGWGSTSLSRGVCLSLGGLRVPSLTILHYADFGSLAGSCGCASITILTLKFRFLPFLVSSSPGAA